METVDRKYHLTSFVHLHHFPQKRKYTGEPYTDHLRSVAKMAEANNLKMGYEIGLCHDLLEDTACTAYDLTDFLVRHYSDSETDFIVKSVIELTDVFTHESHPRFNRKERKAMECQRMKGISPNSQSIKYCDLIDNTESIVAHDPNFAKVYMKEKADLLAVMNKGEKKLYSIALKQATEI